MATIKGITVVINGETTGLDKALKNVNTTIKDTQSKLKDVEKLLKLDLSNTELLSQKQQTLKEKISATKEKLDALKTAQEQAKAQLESGDLVELKDGTWQKRDDSAMLRYNPNSSTATVANEPGVALPASGGPGTWAYTILGSILILGAGVLLWRRRRFI